jgi:hypothetical protein
MFDNVLNVSRWSAPDRAVHERVEVDVPFFGRHGDDFDADVVSVRKVKAAARNVTELARLRVSGVHTFCVLHPRPAFLDVVDEFDRDHVRPDTVQAHPLVPVLDLVLVSTLRQRRQSPMVVVSTEGFGPSLVHATGLLCVVDVARPVFDAFEVLEPIEGRPTPHRPISVKHRLVRLDAACSVVARLRH